MVFPLSKIHGIQILRGIAAGSIVMLHCIFVYYSRIGPPDEMMAQSGLFLGIGVDIFFVISGFIMMLVSAGRKDGGIDFLVNRITRIAPNYWFYTIVLASIGLALPSLVRAVDINSEAVGKSLLFVPFERPGGDIQPILGVGWTLNYEMFFYLIFALLIWMPAWQKTVAMLVIFSGLFIMAIIADVGPVFDVFFGNTIVFAFVSGMALYLVVERWGRPRPAASIVALALGLVIWLSTAGPWSPTWSARFFVWGMPASLIVYAALGLSPAGGRISGFLERLGDASYSLYLSHTFTITLLFVIWQKLGPASPTLFILAAFLASIAAGFIAHRIIEIPLTQAARKLIDARRRRVA